MELEFRLVVTVQKMVPRSQLYHVARVQVIICETDNSWVGNSLFGFSCKLFVF